MDTFFRFLYEFLHQFFDGLGYVCQGIGKGFATIFNIPGYMNVLNDYKADFNIPEWIFTGLTVILLLIVLGLIIGLFYFLIRTIFKFRKAAIDQESLLEEVANLNDEVAKLYKEKEDILAMQVSKLGIRPDEEVPEGAEPTAASLN